MSDTHVGSPNHQHIFACVHWLPDLCPMLMFKCAHVACCLQCKSEEQMKPCVFTKQVGTVVEAAVSELEAMVVTLQPESFVGNPQACLFYK